MKRPNPEMSEDKLWWAGQQKLYRLKRKQLSLYQQRIAARVPKDSAMDFALHHHVNTRGDRMNFKDASYLAKLYVEIEKSQQLVVEKSVQTGLSELFIIKSHIEAGVHGMTVMYILPKYELRNRFVNNRIYKLHRRVPRYAQMVEEAESNVHRTSLMHFGRGTLVYVGSNVEDEFIEIPVDSVYIDEKDRCNGANLLMAPDRLTASPYKYQREISNPTVQGYGIDERYEESTKGLWMIKDPHNGKWFHPDFFEHVVEQVGYNEYRVRSNPEWQPGDPVELIGPSGKPVDRLVTGDWVHEHPNREWRGFRISQVFSKFVPLSKQVDTWFKAVGNERKMQLFYNSNLGLPYSAVGAKIQEYELDACRLDYEFPAKSTRPTNPRFIGVDVGEMLHVVVRERIKHEGVVVLRMLEAAEVPGFQQLAQLIRYWEPRIVVIDAMPEIHKVMDLKGEFDSVYSSRFQKNQLKMQVDKKGRIITMDRTTALDYVQQYVGERRLTIPMQGRELVRGTYYRHMTSPTRVLQVDENNPEKSAYEWVHTMPDHFFLAEAYCLQANMMLPDYEGVFEFFDSEAQASHEISARRVIPDPSRPVEEREEVFDQSQVSQEQFLSGLQDRALKSEHVPPPVPVDDIVDSAEFMHKTQGYVDVSLLAQMTSANEGDVKRVLRENGYVTTHFQGRMVKG